MPSNTSNMMATGTYLKDLKSSIDIAATRLLTMGISQGDPPLTPSLTGGSLFVTSHHSTGKQTDKGGSTKRQKKSLSGGLTTR